MPDLWLDPDWLFVCGLACGVGLLLGSYLWRQDDG